MKDIILSEDHIITRDVYQTPQEHRHFAKQLMFGIDEALICKIDGSLVYGLGLCIASNVSHTAKTTSGKMLLILVEETSKFSEKLNTLLKDSCYIVLEDSMVNTVAAAFKSGALQGVEHALFPIFHLEDRYLEKYDSRITKVLQILEECNTIEVDIFQQLSDQTALSKSRLSHIFKEQVKISLASYIVMAKMRKAAKYVLQGERLTTASYHAGFSSSAHMAATCKQMFGNSLSELFSIK